MEIPTYKQALERHETPLDTFVSRWEPVEKTDKKNFRDDLAALIAYIESAPAPDVCPHCLQTIHYHNCPVITGWQGEDICTDAKHTGPFFTNADGNRECRACGEYWG